MNEYMSKTRLVGMIQTARADWEDLLAGISEAWMIEPGIEGQWSIKDIIAHIAWGERENVGVAHARALVGSELWRLPQDERNAAVFEQNRHRELHDVLADSRQVFDLFQKAISALSEEELNEPSRFAGMPDGWRPWRILYDPGHYQGHADSIRAWLAQRKGAS